MVRPTTRKTINGLNDEVANVIGALGAVVDSFPEQVVAF